MQVFGSDIGNFQKITSCDNWALNEGHNSQLAIRRTRTIRDRGELRVGVREDTI